MGIWPEKELVTQVLYSEVESTQKTVELLAEFVQISCHSHVLLLLLELLLYEKRLYRRISSKKLKPKEIF